MTPETEMACLLGEDMTAKFRKIERKEKAGWKWKLEKEGLEARPLAGIHARFKINAVRLKLKPGSFETVPSRVRRL